ncbi:MAG: class I SAM-dependent RNA methyltransferase [Acidobacteriaceae bacterium]
MFAALNPADLQPQDHATPPCPHFGSCGGCQLQHFAYSAQLRDKATHLHSQLQATGLPLPELQLHPSPPLAYRNRIRLTLVEVDGQLRAGYLTSFAPGNQQRATINQQPAFLPITACPIAAPILWRATEAFLALLNQAPDIWLRNPHQIPDQLELFTTADESRLQLTLYLRTAMKSLPKKLAFGFTALCEALRTRVPELSGAGIALLPALSKQRNRRSEQPRPGLTWGSPGLNYTVAPLEPRTPNLGPQTYWVPRGAFFQINRFLLPELLALVTNNRTGAQAFDLYAGVGLFSRALAEHFSKVTAVEIAEPAFTALAAGSKTGKLPNFRAIKATTLDFLRAAVLQRDRPSLVVLDPPRSGAGPEVCSLLARIAAPTLVYVSCSPESLPADLITLTASGYRIDELHLLDLFPQTTHIETVAVLTR